MKIIRTKELELEAVNHQGGAKKKVILQNGYIKNLVGFSKALFKPGESAELHQHESKYEVFYIEKGKIKLNLNGQEIEMSAGDSAVAEPGEEHSFVNESDDDVEMLYFGVAVE